MNVKDSVVGLIAKNFSLLAMWVAACVLGWKILDRPSGWATVAVVFIVVVCGAFTFVVTNPPAPDAAKVVAAKRKKK